MIEYESRFYRHVKAEDGPLWRHGRAWFSIRQAGRLHPPSGRRSDLGVNFEWRLFPKRGSTFGVGWQIKWGTNGSETTPDLSIHLGRLGDLWVMPSGVIPYRWLERHHPDGRVDYDTRVFSVNVGAEVFRWEWWNRADQWSRSDPWWMRGSVNYKDRLFGRHAHRTEVTGSGVTVIPMPEGPYPATWEQETSTWTRTSRLGRARDRVFGPLVKTSVRLTPGKPVPVPGKGESDWDCGDDHIHSVGGATVEDAVANMVRSALRTRKNYDGLHMNIAGGDAK
jgi:hypothetical protein